MKSINIIALANIKKRKSQSIAIIISLTLASLLFASTLLLLQSIHRPFDQLFERTKASHLLLFFDRLQQDEQALNGWFEKQEEVINVNEAVPIYMPNKLLFQGKEIDKLVQLVEHSEVYLEYDQVLLLEGEGQVHPAINEIWLPNHLALALQIKVGDTLDIPVPDGVYPLIVSALVADPHYASAVMNPTRAWVASGSLGLLLPVSQMNQVMMGVRLKDASKVDKVWNQFNEDFFYSGMMFSYHFFKSVFLSLHNILLAILLIFSILAIIVAIFILYNSIVNAILADFRQIGTLKAQGFTKQQLLRLYFRQYFTLLIISLPIGLLAAYVLSQQLLQSLLQSVGVNQMSLPLFLPFTITIVFFCLIVGLVVYGISKKATCIHPVEAIRFGAPEKSFQSTRFKSLIHKVQLPTFLSIRMLLANKKQSIFTLFSSLFTIFLLVFVLNISHSLSKMSEYKAMWGFEEADLHLKRNESIAVPLKHQDFLAVLAVDSSIQRIMPFSYTTASTLSSKQQAARELIGKVYSKNLDEIGLVNLEGRHPETASEIALCILTAREQNKAVSDQIELFLEGQNKTFRVTAIYQDIGNLGQGFRLHENAIKELNPLFEPDIYAVQLADNQSIEENKLQLQQYLAETATIELSVEQRNDIRAIIGGMQSALWTFAFFFLTILMSIFFNDTLNHIQQEQKNLGIIKTLGFSQRKIRSIFIYKNVVLVMLSILIGIPFAMLSVPVIISTFSKGIGITNFPYVTNWLGLSFILPVLLLVALLSVFLTAKRIGRVSAKDLVVS